jgi:ADP-heptose:LPS heptosyltransferase
LVRREAADSYRLDLGSSRDQGDRMNVAKMRQLDRWLGVPACFVLTLVRKLFGWRSPGQSFVPERILFVKLAEQGSTVLAGAALRCAIQKVGRENVFFLLFAENRPILDLMELIPAENVIAINAGNLRSAVFGALAAIYRMRRAKIDAAIDLEFFARSSAALCYLSGARGRAGYHSYNGEAAYRGDLMTHRLSFNPYLHTSQTFQILVEALDQPASAFPRFDTEPPPIEPLSCNFRPRDEEVEAVERLLESLLGSNAKSGLLLLNANASDLVPLRRWPSERYVELARRLLGAYQDMRVIFTGAPGEASVVDELVKQVGSSRCVSVAGKTSLRQLLVLYSLAEVLVTNDSGPAHFATLTPVDVVVLFGPETPRLFAAVSPRTHPLWAGTVCSPCINAFNDRNSACTDNVCMQRIGVNQVFEEVCRLYDARRLRQPRTLPLPVRRSA